MPRIRKGVFPVVIVPADDVIDADIVEEPQPGNAPSTLGVVGHYILSPEIFDHLEGVKPCAGGEIQLTDANAAMLASEPVLAYEFKGRRYDCGSKLGYLEASVGHARRRPEMVERFSGFIAQPRIEAHPQNVGSKST
jgi:UTP--glucose-1-phosphate uridylyltransferase